MPNSLQRSAIGSPASRRATNCSLSSITEHSFHGITPSQKNRRKCHPCVRYDVLPMSQAAQNGSASSTPSTERRIQRNPVLRFQVVVISVYRPSAVRDGQLAVLNISNPLRVC